MAIDSFDETIIVADNDSMMRGLLRTVLDRPRRRLLLCADGLEAIEFASQTVATLVLLDLRMPRLGGIEACQQMRGLPGYTTVPIVILTVFDDDALKQRALRSGATAFLSKPLSSADLLGAVNPLIELEKLKPGRQR